MRSPYVLRSCGVLHKNDPVPANVSNLEEYRPEREWRAQLSQVKVPAPSGALCVTRQDPPSPAMPVIIEEVTISQSPRRSQWARLNARVSYGVGGPGPEDLWFEVPAEAGDALLPRGDAFVVAMAPLAALLHQHIEVRAPLDAHLRDQVQEVTRVWRAWYPDLREVKVTASGPATPRPEGTRVASFFSGGVDSFFTVLRHMADQGTPATCNIDDLILVHGFDIPLANEAAFLTVETSLVQAAQHLGKRLVVVATNLRDTQFASTDWSRLSHGAALAAVAHAVGAGYHTVLIGSSAGYRDLRFWGSHPLTDPMLTSAQTRVLHDGPAFMRVEKTEYVARSPVALAHLRVCWRSDDGRNCGRCNTCYRTMLALECLGVLDRCATFDRASLDMDAARRIFCEHDYDVRQFGYVVELAMRCHRPDIATAVQASLRGSRGLHRRLGVLRWLRRYPRWRDRARALERRMRAGWI